MKPGVVKLAARRSALARLQAYLAGAALQRAQPGLTIEYQFRESLGDQRADEPLWQMPEKGVFAEDLRGDLLAGRCDLVVHSWKDLPVELHPQTIIAATLPRADQRDLLLVRADRWAQVCASGVMTVLTSSPRRAQNLKDFLPAALPTTINQLRFVPVRGNIQTRVQKLWTNAETDGAEGLIVAKAALDRLLETEADEFAATRAELRAALAQCYWMVLPLRLNPTAPAQGALALETRADQADLRELLQAINCADTYAAVERERAILRGHGGGCHQAIGVSVLRRPYGEITFVRGLDPLGNELLEASLQPRQPRPAKVPRHLLWPARASEHDWFVRTALPVVQPPISQPLWIAKAEALPAAWQIAPTQLVWASGWQTWRKLAARGVWVHGSAESLGEQEAPQVETLHGAPVRWLKLTHDLSTTPSGMEMLATYHLQARADEPVLRPGFTEAAYYFWTSSSAFQRALMLHPGLREGTHFCGPGTTQHALQAAGVTPHIFLDHDQWLAELSL
jgi:hydroxymethylbilane synthase